VRKQQAEPLVIGGGIVRPVSLGSYFEDVPGWVAAVLQAVEHDGVGVEVHGEMEGEGKRGIVIGIDAPTAVI
jgi:hypothetical protein